MCETVLKGINSAPAGTEIHCVMELKRVRSICSVERLILPLSTSISLKLRTYREV
ncbi:Uncharacterized protein DAT39_001853 [Clarias magur]|uniref:Uncharacterized protein n=1 Tax=Clarias magur TaxID=1594786 RepID=A0A8J4UF60_CLAMG|nr:Uncharacterized protein DAT39_001853 [Clarias magur]